MRSEVFMVANSASLNGWLLDVQGGGWEHYKCKQFPAVVRGALAGIFLIEEGEFDTTPALTFKVTTVDPAAEVLLHAEGIYGVMNRGPAHPGVQSRWPFVVPFEFETTSPRVVQASMSLDDTVLASLAFALVE